MSKALAEALRLAERLVERQAVATRLDPSSLFGPQRAFVLDKAKRKTGVCSRRAGKTIGDGFGLVDSALAKPGSVSLYLTLDRTDAKQIVWEEVLDLNRRHALGGEPNESDLTLRLPNRSTVLLAGAGDPRKVKKRRGMPLGIAIVDEAQNFSEVLKDLVEDVLEPALMDYDGELWLTGTPSAVPTGYFHKCAHSSGWSHHAWTFFDNPWIEKKSGKTHRQHLADVLKRRGVTEDDPSIQREFFGRWCVDANSLVFRYDKVVNDYTKLPGVRRPWEHIIGVDLGFDDADAIAVLAWSEDLPALYLVDEWVGAKQTVTELGERLRGFEARYKPLAIVADTGGLGKKIAREITMRTSIPIEAADKQRKLEHIELLNDALRSGRFFARADSRFAQDALLVEWDRDKSTNERRVVSERYHSDVVDAVLYAYRRAQHWLHEPADPPPPPPGSEAWAREQTQQMEREEVEQWQDRKDAEEANGWESWEGWR